MNTAERLMTALGVGVMAAGVLVSACTGTSQEQKTEKGRIETVHLEDGRTIQCVTVEGVNKIGLDCNWATLK